MALTLESEQRLERVGLVDFYQKKRGGWQRLARQSYRFLVSNLPDGTVIHRDDVAKILVPLLEVNEALIKELGGKKLKQKYWIRDFGDLILDRTWKTIKGRSK